MRSGIRQGGVEPFVAEELLDRGDFTARVEQLRGASMPESVGLYRHACPRPAGFDRLMN
jgi:hypothetical protein